MNIIIELQSEPVMKARQISKKRKAAKLLIKTYFSPSAVIMIILSILVENLSASHDSEHGRLYWDSTVCQTKQSA